MPERSEIHVEAEAPDSPIHLRGTDHITVEGTNMEATIEFYRDILGIPLVLSQPNLDRSELTHLFFDTGDGRLLTFFVNDERESSSLPDPDPGQVHHLAFRINSDRIEEIKDALSETDYPCSEYDRGAFHSLYTQDNNGLTIELVADKFAIPDDRRGEVLATAQRKRVNDGADFVKKTHMREALDELEIDVEAVATRDAPSGRDY